jgi:type IV secretory pathway VirB10-like protein
MKHKPIGPAPTSTCVDTSTTTTTSSTTTTVPDTTTTTSSTTTTIPAPPPPPPEPEEPYVDPYVKEDKEVIMEDGTVGTYSQSDIDDGTVQRDNERQANEDLYGCYITNVALERGDCDIPEEIIEEEIIIIIDEEYEDEIDEEEYDTKEELPDDVIVVLELDNDYEDEEFIELTEEEVLELEKQMELEVELLEREEEF